MKHKKKLNKLLYLIDCIGKDIQTIESESALTTALNIATIKLKKIMFDQEFKKVIDIEKAKLKERCK